jgi:hypothetical protein
MFDRLFLPALAFVVLVAATSAFAIDALHSAALPSHTKVVQLERVVIVAKRDATAATIAVADTAADHTTAVR